MNGGFKTATRMYIYIPLFYCRAEIFPYLVFWREEKVSENTVSDFILLGHKLPIKLNSPDRTNLSHWRDLLNYICTVLETCFVDWRKQEIINTDIRVFSVFWLFSGIPSDCVTVYFSFIIFIIFPILSFLFCFVQKKSISTVFILFICLSVYV